MANAGMRGRPIGPLVLSQQERAYLERQVRRQRVARSLSSCAASEVTGWAPDLSAKGGAEGACRLIADRGRNGLQGGRVPLEHGFGQGDAPINQVLHRRHPDLPAEALAEG